MRSSWDGQRFGRAFAKPEGLHITYGIVDADESGNPHIILKDDAGNPNPYGPMVVCTLQPSGTRIPCRVLSQVAGDGEADWYPYAVGDEVLVLLPEGDERAGAVIVGRLNQEIDKWPTVVAGQDSTQNKFGFRRMRAPYVIETAQAFLIRSATTGAQIGIDPTGQVVIGSAERDSILLGTEALGFTSGDGETFIQAFPPTKEVYLGAGQATFLLTDKGTKFISTGPISFATVGGQANQRAVTAEQVVALIINVLAQLATSGNFNPTGPLGSAAYNILGGPAAAALIAAVVQPAVLALSTPTPYGAATPAVPGGSMALFTGTVFGPTGALEKAMANPVAANDPTGTVFGFGRAGFKL